MQKRLVKYIVLILLIAAGIYLLQHKGLIPSFSDIFKNKSPQIDHTAIIIREINNLAQLYTITAYNEVAIDSVKKGWALFKSPLIPTILNIPNLKAADEKLVLVGKGKIMAGIDLLKLRDSMIFIKDDSVSITLPPAEILQVVLNPSDFETFEESGTWTDQEVIQVKTRLRNKLIAEALQQKILQKANDKAGLIIESFLRTSGFNKITVVTTVNDQRKVL